MKNLFRSFLCLLFLSACNNKPGENSGTKDSLQMVIHQLRDSLKKYPNSQSFRRELVETLQEAGLYKEAIMAMDSMNIAKGDSANLKVYFNFLFKRAELLQLAGDTTKAIETLELIVTPGELTEAGLQLANLYAETKNPKTLIICDAMNKNDSAGTNPNPDYLKGVYYYNLNEYDKSLEQFNSCIRKDYTFLDAYMEKGRIYFKQKKYTDAIDVYNIAINVSSTFADAYYWKGKCEEAVGHKEDAKLNYQRAFALDKTLTEAKEAAEKLK
jgi:tetratricopeptide (TPR) repeat protein